MPKSSIRRKAYHECSDCFVKFKNGKDLLDHICEIVDDSGRGDDVAGQLKEVEPGTARQNNKSLFSCDVCLQSFKTSKGVKMHALRTHRILNKTNNAAEFEDEIYDTMDEQLMELKHESLRDVPEFEDEIIGNIVDPSLELIHTKGRDSAENLFSCSICSRSFKTARGLNIHTGRHPNNKTNSESMTSHSVVEAKREKRQMYSCLYCPQKFQKIRDYRIHYGTHKLNEPTDSVVVHSRELMKADSSFQKGTDNEVVVHSSELEKADSSFQRSTDNEVVVHSSELVKADSSFQKSSGAIDYFGEKVPHSGEFSSRSYSRELVMTDSSFPKISEPESKIVESESVSARYKCPNCPEVFQKFGSYRRHLCSHLNVYSYVCKHCLMSFRSKTLLLGHIEQHHKGEKKFSCTLCDKKFYHHMGLMQHSTEHLSGPPYECPACDASFPTVTRRIRHMNNHVIKCPICRIPCASNADFWSHTAKVHGSVQGADIPDTTSEEGVSDCAENSSSGVSEMNADSDDDSFSSDGSDKEAVVSTRKRSKKHVCFICEQRFSFQRSLDFHMKSHKIHQCVACPRFFPRAAQLKRHQQEHVRQNVNLSAKAFNDLQMNSDQGSVVLNIPGAGLIAQNIYNGGLVSNAPAGGLMTNISAGGLISTDLMTTSVGDEANSRGLTVDSAQSELGSLFISWYNGFKDQVKFLKYPIGDEVFETISGVAEGLKSILSDAKSPPETIATCFEIYNVLKDIESNHFAHKFKDLVPLKSEP